MNSFTTDTLSGAALPVLARMPAVAAPAGKDAPAQSPTQPSAISPLALPSAPATSKPTQPPALIGTLNLRVLGQALASGGAAEARLQLASALATKFNLQGVAIAWQTAGASSTGAPWQWVVSGEGSIERRSTLGQFIQAAAAETWLQRKSLDWRSTPASPTPPTLRQLGEHVQSERVCSIPLQSRQGQLPAVMVLWGDASFLDRWLADLRSSDALGALAGLVHLLTAATPSRMSPTALLMRQLGSARGRWIALVAAVVLGVATLVPVPDRVTCSAQFEPQLRRYIASPFDATLEKSLVRTGDEVKQGQPLAQLDPRPLQLELSILRGEREEALKRRDAARAKGQAAVAQIAELEAEQLAGKLAHVEHRLGQLSVTCPIDGVIVHGELERAEGAPLPRGSNMFEVAPLSALVAELAVPEDEVALVKPGMSVTLWPVSNSARTISGTIDRVHPRAEIRENQNVFIADIIVANDTGVLRPGMQARAVVWSDAQPLGWTLIRRPYLRLLRWMWW